MRIAQGLGLHRDGDGSGLSAFEAEIRRRVWWQILVLDMRASEDRGSEPLILEGSFNTRIPHNLDDTDFGFHSQNPLPEKKGLTTMTFCLLSMDVSNIMRKINFISVLDEHQTLSLAQKEEVVKNCTDRIESIYLAGSDPNDQSTWLMRTLGRLLILKLWLVLRYPLQSRQPSLQQYPKGQSLRTAVGYLSLNELIEESPAASRFIWFFSTYVPWHTLAVALVELCTEVQGPLADRAWSIINRNYKKWSDRVADTKDGMLWRPIKSLFKKAQAARKGDQKPFETSAASVSSGSDPGFRSYDTTPGISSDLYAPMAFGNPSPLSQVMDPPLEFDPFAPVDISMMDMGLSTQLGNWDNWNEFVFDMGTTGPENPVNSYEEWLAHIFNSGN